MMRAPSAEAESKYAHLLLPHAACQEIPREGKVEHICRTCPHGLTFGGEFSVGGDAGTAFYQRVMRLISMQQDFEAGCASPSHALALQQQAAKRGWKPQTEPGKD